MKDWNKILLIGFLLCLSVTLRSQVQLKADNVDIDYKNQIWTLRNKVFMNARKHTLQADEMYYYRKEKRFFATGSLFIHFYGENRKVWGDFLEQKDNVKTVRGNPLKVVDKEGKREITASNLTMTEGKKKSMTFFGSVKIKEDDSVISSDKIVYYEDQGKIDLPGMSLISKPQENLEIRSRDVVYNEKTKESVFVNPVDIKRKDGTIKADGGSYAEKEDSLNLKGHIEYKEAKRSINSDTLVSRKVGGEKVLTFEDNISLTEDDLSGTCERVDYFEKQEIINLEGNAQLKDEKKELGIRSTIITVDKKKDLVYLLGRLLVKQKDKVISGDKGIYNKETQEIAIQGNALYKKGRDVSRAEIIILNTNTNEVKMIGVQFGKFRSEGEDSAQPEKKEAQK